MFIISAIMAVHGTHVIPSWSKMVLPRYIWRADHQFWPVFRPPNHPQLDCCDGERGLILFIEWPQIRMYNWWGWCWLWYDNNDNMRSWRQSRRMCFEGGSSITRHTRLLSLYEWGAFHNDLHNKLDMGNWYKTLLLLLVHWDSAIYGDVDFNTIQYQLATRSQNHLS